MGGDGADHSTVVDFHGFLSTFSPARIDMKKFIMKNKTNTNTYKELIELVKKNHDDDYSVSSMEEVILKEEEFKKLVSQKT